MGLSEGCRLKRDLQKDQPITYRDVELPKDRLCDRLRTEQDKFFNPNCDCRGCRRFKADVVAL
ncbi:MAG: hypothetical protein QNK29_08310, partial [Desulfobacterales bacterium]|nr:hypothetical protein [Desulfobacterales bacterium]